MNPSTAPRTSNYEQDTVLHGLSGPRLSLLKRGEMDQESGVKRSSPAGVTAGAL
jgi:hypothetical protein